MSDDGPSGRAADAIGHVDVGDTIHIAWADDGTIKKDSFVITEIEYGLQNYLEVMNTSRYAFVLGTFDNARITVGLGMHQTVAISRSADRLEEYIEEARIQQSGDQ